MCEMLAQDRDPGRAVLLAQREQDPRFAADRLDDGGLGDADVGAEIVESKRLETHRQDALARGFQQSPPRLMSAQHVHRIGPHVPALAPDRNRHRAAPRCRTSDPNEFTLITSLNYGLLRSLL
jgi:hypothetical protein